MDDVRGLLHRTSDLAADWLAEVDERRVSPDLPPDEIRARFDATLPEDGEPALEVVETLARAADPGLVATPGPRYFGFVIGGSMPAALGADWLTSAWDQNAGLYVMSPAASIVEDIAARWVLELTGLPPGAGVGFTTGATLANFTGLAAARSFVLDRAGWDVEARGLIGAPPVRIFLGDEAHATVPYALRLLGFGAATATRVASDEQGAMRADALRDALRDVDGPAIVAAQAGNVNTGAFDPLGELADIAHERGAWLHVDGAFGFWAAASPRLRHLTAGMERADSWTTDAHKWLNVPYDCGIAIVADPRWQQRAMSLTAAYLIAADKERDPYDWVPDASRRARGTTVYAALRSLGRNGLAALIERSCDLASRFADGLRDEPGTRILNDVVLNQVLVRFDAPDPADTAAGDARTRAVIGAIQRDGTLWAGGTTWRGLAALRISVSNWTTTEQDVDRSIEAIIRCATSESGDRTTPQGVAAR
jgi:glutamate/tyrosine decarboxylase-like PLP-dependent enzyme